MEDINISSDYKLLTNLVISKRIFEESFFHDEIRQIADEFFFFFGIDHDELDLNVFCGFLVQGRSSSSRGVNMYAAGEEDLGSGRELEHLEVETDAFWGDTIALVHKLSKVKLPLSSPIKPLCRSMTTGKGTS